MGYLSLKLLCELVTAHNSSTTTGLDVSLAPLTQDCLAPSERRTMGWKEQGWIACLSFLGFVVSVQSISRDELFPFGPSARDQLLEPGNDQTYRLDLSKPVLFYDGTFRSIFVS